jgi:DNA-binding transcriptional ArsR family regulator
MKNSTLDHTVLLARALGHPARLRTVSMLRTGEMCVCQITEVLRLAPSTVSAHLKELKLAGLTVERKDGKWVWVGLSDERGIRSWISTALAAAEDDPQLQADDLMVSDLRSLPVADLCRFGAAEARARIDTDR